MVALQPSQSKLMQSDTRSCMTSQDLTSASIQDVMRALQSTLDYKFMQLNTLTALYDHTSKGLSLTLIINVD
jgi:regulator of sirC expression with transglutaminase-like and TPR domain